MPLVSWAGHGWRIWRVELDPQGLPTLRNPWDNSGQTYWWQPGEVQQAECFWPLGASPMVSRCSGYVSERCTCGIRSMATLTDLAAFLARDRHLIRYPRKAAVVGRVRIGGKMQHRIPGLPKRQGYQRSEFAYLAGPIFVSPFGGASRHFDALTARYSGVEVVGPDLIPDASSNQDWLERLGKDLDSGYPIAF